MATSRLDDPMTSTPGWTGAMEYLNGWSASWASWVFHASWQGSLVAFVLLVMVSVGRRWPSPLRYGLLLVALAKFALPPFWAGPTGLFSRIPLQIGTPWNASAEERKSSPLTAEPAIMPVAAGFPVQPTPRWVGLSSGGQALRAPGSDLKTFGPRVIDPARVANDGKRAWMTALMVAHLLGLVVGLTWITSQFIRLRSWTRHAQSTIPEGLQELLVDLSQGLRLRRRPRVLIVSQPLAPIAFGLVSPTILLPATVVERLPTSELRTILAHELAHYRRGDLWLTWFQFVLGAMWWFNPLVWLLNSALRKTREDCCDDLLLARGFTSREEYCNTLLHAAKELARYPAFSSTALVPGFVEPLHPLARRLERIMDQSLPRASHLSLAGLFIITLGGGLILPGLRGSNAQAREAKSEPRLSNAANPSSATLHSRMSIAELFDGVETHKAGLKRSQLELVTKLRRHGQPAVQFLDARLQRKDAEPLNGVAAQSTLEERRRAAWLLAKFGPAAASAVPSLTAALEDLDTELAALAAAALEAIGPAARSAVPALVEAVRFQNPRAPMALARVAPESRDVVQVLLEAFDSRHSSQAPEPVVFALSELRGHRERIETALVEAATSADQRLTGAIGFALNRIGASSPTGREIVTHWKSKIQKEAIANEAAITPEGLLELVARLKQANWPVEQSDATRQLIQSTARLKGNARSAVPALMEFVRNNRGHARGSAVIALGNIGPAATAAVPLLIQALDEEEAGVSHNALVALGQIGPAASPALPRIRERFERSDGWVRLAAAIALWRIQSSHLQSTLPVLIEALQPHAEDMSYIACTVLGEMGPSAASAAPRLIQIATDANHHARIAAALALAKVDPNRALVTLPYLLDLLRDEHGLSRPTAASALGELGSNAKEAVPLLMAVRDSLDPALRDAASEALKRIGLAAPGPE